MWRPRASTICEQRRFNVVPKLREAQLFRRERGARHVTKQCAKQELDATLNRTQLQNMQNTPTVEGHNSALACDAAAAFVRATRTMSVILVNMTPLHPRF